MENNKTISKQTKKYTYKKSKTIALFIITLFGVFFLSGMGLITNDYFGAGLLGGQMWFFWGVVSFVSLLTIVFSVFIINWIINGVDDPVVRSIHLYCWSLLFVCSFVIGLQSATFGALNAQVINLGFVAFGNIFSILWVVLIFFATGLWVYTIASRSHLEEHPYKVLRNYFFWIIAFSLFIFHFEQASSGALGVDTEKVLLNTDLGDNITSNLTKWLEAGPDAISTYLSKTLGTWAFENKDTAWPLIEKIYIYKGETPEYIDNQKILFYLPYNKRGIIKGFYKDIFGALTNTLWNSSEEWVGKFGTEEEFVFSLVAILFGKGAFWGLNNSWSGWTIFVTVIIGTISITAYAFSRFIKKNVHNVDNPFFVLTPLIIIIFTIFMYSINAYIVTFISNGSLNPGIVGSHIGHLQQDVPADASVIQIIQAHWMFNILKYPVGDVFAGSYNGTAWWWIEWTLSLVGLNAIIFGSLFIYRKQIKEDFLAKKWEKIKSKIIFNQRENIKN